MLVTPNTPVRVPLNSQGRQRPRPRRGNSAPAPRCFGPRLERLEDRVVLAVDAWICPNFHGGSWSDPTNWSLKAPPAQGDIAYFSQADSPYGCTVNTPAEVDALDNDGTYTGSLTLSNSLTINGSQGVSQWGGANSGITIVPGPR
jgi:hypothetical protein